MNRILLIQFILGIVSVQSIAQTTGDYRSAQSGSWTDLNTWQRFTGAPTNTWVTPTLAQGTPTSASGAIEVQAGHVVNVPSGATITVDLTTINGTLQIDANGSLIIAAATGTDLTVGATGSVATSGTLTLNNSATITQNTGSAMSFLSGSRYRHLSQTEGVVPVASWAVTSTLELAGFTAQINFSAAGNWSQSFGNVEFNLPPAYNNRVEMNGLMTTINGNFIITSSGTGNSSGQGAVRFMNSPQTVNATIGGSILVNGSSNLHLNYGGTLTLAVAGSITLNNSGDLWLARNSISTITAGSVSMNSSSLLSLSESNLSTTNLNVTGNFTQTAGSITEAGNASTITNINFTGNTTQFFSRSGGSILNTINFTVASSAIVDAGTSTFTGSGTFTLSGTLRTAAAGGLNATLPLTGGRVFNSNCTVEYNGTAAQVIGTFYPTTPPAGMNLVINNAAGVTTSANTVVTGTLSLLQGNLNTNLSHTLQIEGDIVRNTGNINMLSGSNLTVNGSGSMTTDPFPFNGDQSFAALTLNRSSYTLNLANNVQLSGACNLNNGVFGMGSFQLTLGGNIAVTSGTISGTSSSVLSITGTGTTTPLNFETGGNILGDLLINRPSTDVDFGGDFTIANQVVVTAGNFNGGSNVINVTGSSWNVDEGAGGYFFGGTGTVIFAGATTIVNGNAIGSFNNLELTAAANLTFPAGAALFVTGNIDFNSAGVFNHNNSALVIAGANQTIQGGGQTFYDLVVSETGGTTTLTGGVNLISTLDILSVTDFQSNGFLTLLSSSDDPDASASITALLGGAQVTGDVNTQRFMSGENRIYRYISSPVSDATIADWQNDFAITGSFADPSTTDPITGLSTFCGFTIRPSTASLFYYTESVSGLADAGWLAYPTVSSADPIVPGRGYAPFIRQCTNPTLITVTGTINQGDFDYTAAGLVTYTDHGSLTDDGWNLIGNPYPSAIRWDASGNGWTKGANITVDAFIRDNGAGGVFVPVFEGDVIAQGQAFWVKADGPDVTLIIDETAKDITNTTFYRQTSTRDILTVSLSKGNITDKAFVRLNERASNAYDRYDAPNLNNELFDVATMVGPMAMGINTLNALSCGEKIALQIKDMAIGTYSFRFEQEGLFQAWEITLVDKFTGFNAVIAANETYQFNILSEAASKAADRFELFLSPRPVDITRALDEGITTMCDEQPYVVKVLNPQPFVSYTATINGQIASRTAVVEQETSALDLMISSDLIKEGITEVIIEAQTTCETVYLSQRVALEKRLRPTAKASSIGICKGTSALLTASGAPQDGSYHWYASEDGVQLLYSGKTYETEALFNTTVYYVAAVNSLGCEGPRVAVTVSVPNYEMARITPITRNRIVSNYETGNQWYYNGQLLQGSKGQFLTVTKSGTYRVDIQVGSCITSASYEFVFQWGNESKLMAVYPNPVEAQSELNIELLASNCSDTWLLNANGATVAQVPMFEQDPGVWMGKLDVKDLPGGVYYIRTRADGKVRTEKFIRVR